MEALTATVKLLTEALAQIAGSLSTVTQKLEETAKALFSTAQSLASTKELLASTKEELATTIEELASTEEELASTKEELTSANQSLASTKEEHEQTASALQQSKKDAIEMLKAQIASRNEDIIMAGRAGDCLEYDQEIIEFRLQLSGEADVPDKLREQLSIFSNDFCSEIAITMAPLFSSVARWEEQNKEAITIMKRLES